MKNFLQNTIIFILIFVAVHLVAHKFLVYIVGNETRMMKFEHTKLECLKDAETVFMGDSHVQNSADPTLIQNSTNFSAAGETYMRTYYKILWLTNNTQNIKHVVLPFEPHSFSQTRIEKGQSAWYWKTYVPYLKVWFNGNSEAFAWYLRSNFVQFDDPTLLLDFIKISVGKKIDRAEPLCGYLASDAIMNGIDLSSHATRRVKKFYGETFSLQNEPMEYFEKSIKLLQKNNIKVSLARYPTSDSYNQQIPQELMNNYENYLSVIIKKYDVNFFNLNNASFNEEIHFQNSDHVNNEGAKITSELIRVKLIKQD